VRRKEREGAYRVRRREVDASEGKEGEREEKKELSRRKGKGEKATLCATSGMRSGTSRDGGGWSRKFEMYQS
jgi:hypothetical protein